MSILKMKKVSLIGVISAFIVVSTLTVAVLAASAANADTQTDENGMYTSDVRVRTTTPQQNENIPEEPGISPQSGSFTTALELMQSTGDWSYIESYLKNMPNEGIDFIVNLYNSKQPNSAEHKKASDYYNTDNTDTQTNENGAHTPAVRIITTTPQQDENISEEPGISANAVGEMTTSESGTHTSTVKVRTTTPQQDENISEEPGKN